MAKLVVIYDPNDRVRLADGEVRERTGIKDASLSIPEDLQGRDIYAIARNLAELLLEQL